MKHFKGKLEELLNSQSEIYQLIQLVKTEGCSAWLVGGVLRDLLLKRPLTDIDLATDGDPTELAKQWARQVSGRWFWLDPDRHQSRVLLPGGLTADFAPLRAATIDQDLRLRDFSINALAFPLHEPFAGAELIDPLDGVTHLKDCELHVCSERSFSDDPLRMLKGIRHAVTLRMRLPAETLTLIQLQAPAINEVAGERIKEELAKIFSAEECFKSVELLINSGLLAALLGPPGFGWKRDKAHKALMNLEQQMVQAGLGQQAADEEESQRDESFPHQSLFLFTALLKHYRPANLPDILHRRLRLSRQQQRLILALQEDPSHEWLAQANQLPAGRRQALLVEQLGHSPDEQLLYLAVANLGLSFSRALELRQSYLEKQQLGRVSCLLNGDEIQACRPETPAHALGLCQLRLKAAEISGEIATQEDAINWLKKQNRI